jgi:hypothetical protein
MHHLIETVFGNRKTEVRNAAAADRLVGLGLAEGDRLVTPGE